MSASLIQRAEAEALAKQRVSAPAHNLPPDSKLKVVGDICSFHVFVAQLESFLNIKQWSSVMEAWIYHQFCPGSVAAKTYSLLLQSLPPRQFGGDTRYFQDMAEFKQALYNKFFFCKPIHIVVPEAIRQLHVGKDPAGLSSLLALSNQAKELYSLLPNGPTEEAQVELVKNLLPASVQRELMSSQSHIGRWITSFEDLDRCLALYDDEFARKRSSMGERINNSSGQRPLGARAPLKHQRRFTQHSKHILNQRSYPKTSNPTAKKTGYTGVCDGCGRKGHSIMKCFKTPQHVKDKWLEAFRAQKDKRQANGHNQKQSFKGKAPSDPNVDALVNALVTKLNTVTNKGANCNENPTE